MEVSREGRILWRGIEERMGESGVWSLWCDEVVEVAKREFDAERIEEAMTSSLMGRCREMVKGERWWTNKAKLHLIVESD